MAGSRARSREALVYLAASAVVLLAVWEALPRLDLVDPLFVSAPTHIARRLYTMFFVTGEIYPHLATSALEGVLGFGLAIVVGVPAGLLVGRFRRVRLLTEPYIIALYSTPIVALLPLLILWFGIGLWSKVIIIFLGGVFPVMINTAAGAKAVDPGLIEAAAAFEASAYQIFRKVVLPAAVPYIVAGLRLGIGRVLIMIVVAEMYAATAGIGFFVMRAGSMFDTAGAFVGVIVLVATGVSLAQALRMVERRMAPWLYVDET